MRNVLLTLLHLAVVAARLCGPRWCPRGDRGESSCSAATHRHAPCSSPGAQPDVERPAPLRIHVALSEFGSHSEAGDRLPPVDAVGVSSSVGASQVPTTLLSEAASQETRTEGPDEALIRAIVELKSRNPRFACPRIARIIAQTFGIDIDRNVVHRVLAKHDRPAPSGTGPSWRSFLGHTTDSLWSVDLFRCDSSYCGPTGCSWSWINSRV